ncbi:hypothetical protein INT47_009230, partial [Mucor saturninus]
ANLLTASEPKYFSSLVQATNSPVISTSNTEPISSTSNSSRALPSRVLKDAFHLLDLIKVSLRHGLSKDFIRRFRDALFVIDSDDKRRVEAYLISIGTDWNTRLLVDPKFIFDRVRRYIPPPAELYPMVKLVFDKYQNELCSRTGLPLFDNEAVTMSNRILEEIRQGNVSDVVGGPALYTEIGEDKNGLMRYRCSRGTSSVEGSVHFNIIRKFASYNAGPRLTDAVLSDYRLYHNISVSSYMGSITRHGRTHNWHFSPWISQAINTMRIKLGHAPVQNYFGNCIGDTFSYTQTRETFGITRLPLELTRKYDMRPLDYTTSIIPASVNLSKQRIFDLCLIPVIKLPYIKYSTKQFLYHFLAYCQGTAFAVTAVHTKEETELFDALMISQRDLILSENSAHIMFDVFAKVWSSYCHPNNGIFYKTEEHLYSYYNVLEDRKKYGNTVLLNINISQYVRPATQNPARCHSCLTVPAISQPHQPSSETISQLFSGTQTIINMPVLIQPRPLQLVTRLLVPHPSNANQPPAVVTPVRKRRRNMCMVCNQINCGGTSKRIFCVNKCGVCQNITCPGRYVP